MGRRKGGRSTECGCTGARAEADTGRTVPQRTWLRGSTRCGSSICTPGEGQGAAAVAEECTGGQAQAGCSPQAHLHDSQGTRFPWHHSVAFMLALTLTDILGAGDEEGEERHDRKREPLEERLRRAGQDKGGHVPVRPQAGCKPGTVAAAPLLRAFFMLQPPACCGTECCAGRCPPGSPKRQRAGR